MNKRPNVLNSTNKEETERKSKQHISFSSFFLQLSLVLTLLLASGAPLLAAEEAPKTPTPITTENPDILPDQLNLMVRHMTGDELFVEADGWLVLLKEAAKKVYDTKISVLEKNAQ
ncbi:MAG: hypothetical protein U9Q90_07065, partial [Campylobacterota bacterium]|nr:hypothetical protein [Campylobacterota bacterium]